MKKLILTILLVSLAKPVFAQQVVLICYNNPGGTPVCVPVSSANPLPVISR